MRLYIKTAFVDNKTEVMYSDYNIVVTKIDYDIEVKIYDYENVVKGER